MVARGVGVVLFAGIVGGALAFSQKTDPDRLAAVGQVVAQKVRGALPDAARVTGPLAALRVGDVLGVEERVRVRIRTDKRMAGAEVYAVPGAAAGEVRLRGLAANADQARRAVLIAESTTGVEKVVSEIAVPE
ncbi:MAG: BON domain-containing protein [Gemmataceae bacterium]